MARKKTKKVAHKRAKSNTPKLTPGKDKRGLHHTEIVLDLEDPSTTPGK